MACSQYFAYAGFCTIMRPYALKKIPPNQNPHPHGRTRQFERGGAEGHRGCGLAGEAGVLRHGRAGTKRAFRWATRWPCGARRKKDLCLCAGPGHGAASRWRGLARAAFERPL